MLTLNKGLAVWAIVGPVVAGGAVFGAMLTREAIVTAGAVRAARADEVTRCNEARAEITRTLERSVRDSVEAALAAANAERPTPTVQAEIEDLCRRSASCRDRHEVR